MPDIVTTLLVKERGSGRLIGHVLVPVVCEGRRYLVSMLGAGSNWVLDQRETGGAAFLRRGRTGNPSRLWKCPLRFDPEGLVSDRHRPPTPTCRSRRADRLLRGDRRRLSRVSGRSGVMPMMASRR